jgi:hypothetical protein
MRPPVGRHCHTKILGALEHEAVRERRRAWGAAWLGVLIEPVSKARNRWSSLRTRAGRDACSTDIEMLTGRGEHIDPALPHRRTVPDVKHLRREELREHRGKPRHEFSPGLGRVDESSG